MGQDKRRLRFRGSTVLESAVAALRLGGVDPVVVVLESDSPCRTLPGLRQAIVAVNPAPQRGMLSSIRVGLEQLREATAVAVLPGDHPFVPLEAVAALVSHYHSHHPLLLAPRYPGNRRGHPLIIDRALFEEAAACDDAVGLRQLVHQREGQLALLDLDCPDAEQDLDLPQHLKRLRRE